MDDMAAHLKLAPDEMRRLGYRVIDLLVAHHSQVRALPVTRKATRPALEAKLREPLPESGMAGDDLLDLAAGEVFSNIMHLDHPRFFAFVPGPSNFIGVLGDALAAGFNVFAGTWLEASGPTQVELVVIDWLRQACGLPACAGGLFVSGGSMANITALAVARHIRLDDEMDGAVVYCSDQTHSSVERGLRVLGFRPGQLRKVASDGDFRLDLEALAQAVAADRAAGLRPVCVVANAGTTNTGSIDPLPALSDYCQAHGLWLHVDGAYGGAAVLSERGRALLAGLEQADSVIVDPHKWLFQPYEIGCVLVREEAWLRDCFHILPEYMADVEREAGEVNFCDRGIQLTRGFRALKLWLSLKYFGRAAFAAAIERGFALAEAAEQMVRALPDWVVVSPAQMGVVTFRHAPPHLSPEAQDAANHAAVEAMIADGYAMVTSTVLRGRTVLRLCTINPRTTEEEIAETLRRLDSYARKETLRQAC
jgi:glutamate/tyrosine decarboxylase-like PLP-dependent enzyme